MKIKVLLILIVTFCIINISSVLADSTSSASVTISSATVSDKVISIEGTVTGGTNQQIVVMVYDIATSFSDVRYLNQFNFDDIENGQSNYYSEGSGYSKYIREGKYKLSFNIKELLSQDSVYVVSVGGTDIDEPAQMIIMTNNGNTELLLGDVNLDGNITAADAAITLQYVLFNLEYLTQNQIDAMKVTKSETITSENAAQILAKVLDSMYVFPVNQ